MAKFLDSTGLSHLIEKIKAAFIAKTDTIAATSINIDSTPTTNSTNLVTSGGVKSALDSKLNTIDSSNKLSADLISDGTTNKVFTSTEKTKLSGIAQGAEVNVQANWNETDTTSDAYIQNKPNITLSSNGNWDYLNITEEIINLNTSYKAFYDGKEIATKDDIPAVPTTYAASTTAGGAALKTGSIPFGVVDSTSTATAFTATVDGITELTDGTCVLLKNSVVTSAAGFTININNLGAYPAFNNMSAATAETTIFNINYTMLFVFDSTRVVGESTGAWCCYRGYDANTNTIGYQLRTNSSTMPASDKGYRYRLWFTSADGTKYVPANKSTSTNATTARTMNTTPIDPFGRIIYYSTNGTTNAGANLATGTCWQLYAVTIGYSYVLSMTPHEPVYVQCTPQADGSAVMNTLTLTLPSTEDGKIYIFLGIAYSATAMELVIEHPVYYYKNGAIRLWTNAEEVTSPLVINVRDSNDCSNSIVIQRWLSMWNDIVSAHENNAGTYISIYKYFTFTFAYYNNNGYTVSIINNITVDINNKYLRYGNYYLYYDEQNSRLVEVYDD